MVASTSTYKPLETHRSIRLVILYPGICRPGGGSDPVHCELSHVSLEELPIYEALSYVWGDPATTVQIHVEDETFHVTQNLYGAILRLRNERNTRTLWIDAVCINQNDVAEKNSQVAIMAEIYRMASGVVVWLGEQSHLDQKSTAAALKVLTKLGSGPLFNYRNGLSARHQPNQNVSLFDLLRSELQTFSSPFSKDAQVWKILRHLLAKDWFKRTWILQEVVMSKHSTQMICNSHSIAFETLFQACKSIESFGLVSSLNCFNNEDTLVRYMGHLRDQAKESTGHYSSKLSTLLIERRACLATDPRDKVFAILGLAHDAAPLRPDYSQSIQEVYVKAAEHILSYDKNIKLLSEVKGLRLDSGLPSWVPDWQFNPTIVTFASRNSDISTRFTASGSSRAKVMVSNMNEKNVLAIHGFCFDKISHHLGVPYKKLDENPENYVTYSSLQDYPYGLWPAMARSVYKDGIYTPTGEPLVQVYNRVLAADLMITSSRLTKAAKATLYPETSSFISASKSEAEHPLFPQAMKLMKDKNIDLETFIGTYVQGPALYEPADIASGNQMPIDNVPLVILSAIKSETEAVNHAMTGGRRLFISEAGSLGLCPNEAKEGDLICILFGSDTPFALRPLDNGNHLLVGECYVDGLMDGQAILNIAREKVETIVDNLATTAFVGEVNCLPAMLPDHVKHGWEVLISAEDEESSNKEIRPLFPSNYFILE